MAAPLVMQVRTLSEICSMVRDAVDGQIYDSKMTDLKRLQAQNKALSEELVQCQADKEFVWSLWKRLQVANPDVTQAISLVVQREKEKAEQKDRKVLEILQVKDDRITDLETFLSQKQDEFQGYISRNIEVENERKNVKKETKILREKQQQMEQLLESKEVRLKNTEDIHKEVLENLQSEKQDDEKKITSLTVELEKSKQEALRLQASILDFEMRVRDLENAQESITEIAKKAGQEEDKNSKKLQISENNLRQLTTKLRNKTQDLDERKKELNKLRKELTELRNANSQAVEHTAQQADVIQQLQSLQFDTQKVLKDQEGAHEIEVISFKTMYQTLESRYKASTSTEQQLRERLVAAEKRLSARKVTKNVATQANLVIDGKISSRVDREMEGIMERSQHWSEDFVDVKYRQATRAPTKRDLRRARSLSPRRPYGRPLDGPMSTRDDSDVIAVKDSEWQQGDTEKRRIADLRKLLKLKDNELEEMRTAHSRRLERLKALQASHNVLREQIKTYDAEERNQPKKKKTRRSEPRTLQKEDSDAVWNELAYFKQQTVNVLQERMNLHEELDCLRVQAASDATTIKELTTCLEQERQELEDHLTQLRDVRKREKSEQNTIQELKNKINSLEKSLQRLNREKDGLVKDKSNLEADNRSLRMGVSKQRAVEAQKESKMVELRKTINQLKKRLRHLKHRQRHTVAGVSLRRSKTAREHEAILNRSIQEMSGIFPGFDSDDLEISEISGSPRASTSLESLGQQIVETSRSEDVFHTPRRRSSSRMKRLSQSARQLASIRKHLQRMAQAYEEDPVRDVILKSVATQTERVLEASLIDAGVGEYLVSDDVASSVSSSTTANISTMTDQSDAVLKDVATSPHLPLARLTRNVNRKSHSAAGQSLASLKQRVASLQQQVSLLKDSKMSLQRTVTDQEELINKLQSDLSLANQRLRVSKQTIQRLSGELDESNQQRALSEKQLQDSETESKRHSEHEHKQMENRLKAQSSEIARQTNIIKSLKIDLEAKDSSVKTLQEKMSRQDRDINQKRALVEDLRVRARAVDTDNKVASRTTELLEEKITTLQESNEKKKVEIDSIRKQLSAMTKERHHYEELYMKCKAELDKKTKSVNEGQIKLAEAETYITQLKVTTGRRLRELARESEQARHGAQKKIKTIDSQYRELVIFVKLLASNLVQQAQDTRQRLCHKSPLRSTDSLNGSMSRAQGIASSILNMSASDLDEFMASSEEDQQRTSMSQEEIVKKEKDEQWCKQIESTVMSKVVSHSRLLNLFLEKMDEKDQLMSRKPKR